MSQIFVGCFWVLVLLITLFGVVIFLYCGFSKFWLVFFIVILSYQQPVFCFVTFYVVSRHVVGGALSYRVGVLGFSFFFFFFFFLLIRIIPSRVS